MFVLLLWEVGANSCSSLAGKDYCEGNLNFIAWMDELGVINCPECIDELNQLLFT